LLPAIAAAALMAAPARADMVTDWNARAEAIAVEKQIPPAFN
jgi:hypothetical protein